MNYGKKGLSPLMVMGFFFERSLKTMQIKT